MKDAAQHVWKLSDYIVYTNPLDGVAEAKKYRLLYGTRLNAFFIANEAVWDALITDKIHILPVEFIEQLSSKKIIVDREEDETGSIIKENETAIEHHQELYEVIQPTAFCQMGCHYCGQQHTTKLLDEADQLLLLERIRTKLQKGNYSKLKVGWFGAEPLAGLAVIRTMSPRLQQLAKDYGCDFSAKMVTNGLALTEKVAKELEEVHKISFVEITLDGTSSFHDMRRALKNGHATFDQIFRNLVTIAANKAITFKISIRCNVDQQNIEGVSPLLRLLAEAQLQTRISFYTASVYSWGNDAHLKAVQREEFAERELVWFREMMDLGFETGLIPQRKPIVCMAVHKDAELSDAYGNIFNCTEVSYVPAYGTPNIYQIDKLGEEDGKMPLRHFSTFNAQIQAATLPCYQCAMLPVCGGSCPKQWADGHAPCPTAKFNMKGRLEMLYYSTHQALVHAK
ncbi:uncharacterized protein CLV51_103281 [Chitinophaga niastensis]|uniref:Radical SAM core domain-containing protein n=1 Tax=Chitinophaga niastensis TaxID=536980 RepID=A0A2P8HJ97_CHINA|nr:radical SAM protein [Chitinophaga niastensis]PSL46303.1 uncharacterized protein CLV51_103281 [Chitinophaga niastensis]